jgi:LmbE family N-acetylglucosaminyl deacetylase
MANELKLMCVLAHPDDESLGNGGIFAKYAAEGIETHLVTATRGERGWFGEESEHPGLEKLGKIRESELYAAATVIGIQRINFLDYIDGDLDVAHPAEVIAKVNSLLLPSLKPPTRTRCTIAICPLIVSRSCIIWPRHGIKWRCINRSLEIL